MAHSQSIEDYKSQPRLPRFTVPRGYDLFLMPDLSSCTFTGSAAIAVDVVEDTRFLVLNAADLSIETGSVCFKSSTSSEAVPPSKVVLLEQDEILVLQFDELLPRGNGVLGIDFQGR